ncbi:MAG: FG-GAP repeat protein [Acidimicrobiales bacterium]
MAEFEDPVFASIRSVAEAAERSPLGFSLEDVLEEGSARRYHRRPWAHRFGVVLVAAAILVVFFVPLPHLSLFKRLVSSPNPSPATSRSKTLPVGTRLAELRGSDTVAGDYFGAAVAIDGDTAVVGAFEHDNDAGRAYVFSKTSSGWKQTAELEGSDIVAGDNFGVAVGISGSTIVVGASSYEQSSAGRAYVFTKTESGWKQVAELSGPGGRAVQEHISVAISDATIVIGWNYPNVSPPVPGVAWVYADTATGWRRTAVLGGPNTPSFGYSVAVSGSTVIVGAISAPPAQPLGVAYVFTKTATGWMQSAELHSPDASNAFSFGFSTAISGSTALVGSDGAAPVYVFTKAATGWRNVADLKGSDTVTGDGFGSTLAISGSTAVVGAPDSADNIGRAYLFKGTAKGWRQVAVLKGTVAQGYFGSSAAMSGVTAIVGSAPSSGAASLHVGYPVSPGRGYLFQG